MFLRPIFILVITIFTLLNVQAVEIRRGRYRFNHPPSVESVDTVPVAEVHESEITRESKTLKLPAEITAVPTENTFDKREDVKEVNIPVPTPSRELKSEDAVPETPKKNIQRKPLLSRLNSRRNLKKEENIPVNVVYEADSNKLQASQPKSEEGLNKLTQRRNQIRRRLQKPSADDTQKEEQKLKEEQIRKEEQEVREEQKQQEEQKLQEVQKLKEEQRKQEEHKLQEEQKLKEEQNKKEQQSNVDTSIVTKEKKSAEGPSTTVPSAPSPNVETTQTTPEKDQPHVTTERSRRRWRTRAPIVPIVTEENFVYSHSGNFHYRFEGGDGTKVFEEGTLKEINEDAGEAVQGGFSYTDKEGNDYSISYTADENGYRPVGAHIPTPPPIPPAIARALAYLATKPTPQPVTESIKNLD